MMSSILTDFYNLNLESGWHAESLWLTTIGLAKIQDWCAEDIFIEDNVMDDVIPDELIGTIPNKLIGEEDKVVRLLKPDESGLKRIREFFRTHSEVVRPVGKRPLTKEEALMVVEEVDAAVEQLMGEVKNPESFRKDFDINNRKYNLGYKEILEFKLFLEDLHTFNYKHKSKRSTDDSPCVIDSPDDSYMIDFFLGEASEPSDEPLEEYYERKSFEEHLNHCNRMHVLDCLYHLNYLDNVTNLNTLDGFHALTGKSWFNTAEFVCFVEVYRHIKALLDGYLKEEKEIPIDSFDWFEKQIKRYSRGVHIKNIDSDKVYDIQTLKLNYEPSIRLEDYTLEWPTFQSNFRWYIDG